MTFFPPPHPLAKFHGEYRAGIRVGRKIELDREFGFFDGDEAWYVPRHFIFDSASFPWWLRWIPALVAVGIMALDGGTWRAIVYPAVLQWLVGFPLEADVLEAAVIHDRGYAEGDRPKWVCDRAFFRALWLRLYVDHVAGEFGALRAWLRLIRAAVWTGAVFLGGFFAWWGHRRRQRSSIGKDRSQIGKGRR